MNRRLRRVHAGGEEREAEPTARASAPDEGEVVARARAGELSAWTRIYHDHFERLYRYVGYLAGDSSVAEDLTQEVFAKAYVALPSFEARSSVWSWLCGIGINVVREHWRKQGRRKRKPVPGPPPPPGEDGDPERLHIQRQQAAALRTALETLPDHYREAFVLVRLREVPRDEAAALLGVSPGNLSVRVHRAQLRLRKALARAGWFGERGRVADE